MSRILVVGSGGHASVLVSIARRDRVGDLAGYVDLEDRGDWQGLVYLGDDTAVTPGCCLLFGVGLMHNAHARWQLYARHRAAGVPCLLLVSNRSSVADEAQLGTGTVVLDLAAVNAGARLGEACIVNTGAVIEHGARLGDNVHVAPHATLCGDVSIGDHCLIGAAATILPGLSVATGVVVGAGAVVTRDLVAPGVYVGAPAVRAAERSPG